MRHRILVISDELETREFIKSFLDTHEFDVESAPSAEEVLKKYQYEKFDVIIADAQLPGIPGLAFLGIAGQECPTTIKILLTDNANYEKAVRAAKKGEVFRFFAKPFDFSELLEAINQGIENKEQAKLSQIRKAYTSPLLDKGSPKQPPEKLAIEKTQTGSIVLNETDSDFKTLLGNLE